MLAVNVQLCSRNVKAAQVWHVPVCSQRHCSRWRCWVFPCGAAVALAALCCSLSCLVGRASLAKRVLYRQDYMNGRPITKSKCVNYDTLIILFFDLDVFFFKRPNMTYKIATECEGTTGIMSKTPKHWVVSTEVSMQTEMLSCVAVALKTTHSVNISMKRVHSPFKSGHRTHIFFFYSRMLMCHARLLLTSGAGRSRVNDLRWRGPNGTETWGRWARLWRETKKLTVIRHPSYRHTKYHAQYCT